tara:strand:- start:369 stop:641 length:273 start_codon:yes stop_codon:yes gene_type:complete
MKQESKEVGKTTKHRVPGLQPGQYSILSPKDHGDFLIIRMPMTDGDYGYDFYDETKLNEIIDNVVANHNGSMMEAINEKTKDYINDSREE